MENSIFTQLWGSNSDIRVDSRDKPLMSGWKKSPLDMLTCNRRVVCFLLSGRERVRINGSWKLLIKPYKIWFNNKLKGVTDIFESYELISFENYYFCQLCHWCKKKKKSEKKHQAWPSLINTLRWFQISLHCLWMLCFFLNPYPIYLFTPWMPEALEQFKR